MCKKRGEAQKNREWEMVFFWEAYRQRYQVQLGAPPSIILSEMVAVEAETKINSHCFVAVVFFFARG
jgi:hypothetical protein